MGATRRPLSCRCWGAEPPGQGLVWQRGCLQWDGVCNCNGREMLKAGGCICVCMCVWWSRDQGLRSSGALDALVSRRGALRCGQPHMRVE